MAVNLEAYVTSALGVDYKFEIYNDNYGGAAIEVPANDFELVYTPESNELLCPIITSELTLNIYDDGTSGVDTAITSIEESDEPEVRIVMSIDEGSGYEVYWVGIVEKRSLVRMNEPKNTMFIIRASCGLSRLKDIRYPGIANGTHTGSSPMAQFITECLSENGLSGHWGTSDPYIRESIEWVSNAVSSPTANSSPLLYTRCNVLNFRENIEDEDLVNLSCYDVIRSIMILFGAQFFHANGAYYVRQPRNHDSSTHTERRITKLLAVSNASVTNRAERVAPATQSSAGYFHVLAGGEFGREDPLDKVRAVVRPRVLLNAEWPGLQALDNSDKDVQHTVPLGTVTGGTGKKLVILWPHTVMRKGKWEWKCTITVTLPGSPTYYLDHDPATNEFSWSTSSSSYVVYGKPSREERYTIGVTTPDLPSGTFAAATVVLRLEYWDRGTGAQPSNVGNQLIYDRRYDIKLQDVDDAVDNFEVEVDNSLTDTNSRVLDLGDVAFNDMAIISTYNTFEINSTGSTWVTSTTWDAGFDADTNLTYSMLLERMGYQQTPVELYRGGLEGFMRPHLAIVYDSKTWVMHRFAWSGKMDECKGEWWELNSALTGIVVGDDRETDNVDDVFRLPRPVPQDPTDNTKFKLQRIGELASTDGAGSTITQLDLLLQVGHDNVRENDTVAIVHPLTLEILDEFIVSTTAGSSDTTINVTSDTNTYDFEIGYLVMHKVWQLVASDKIRGEQLVIRDQVSPGSAVQMAIFESADTGMVSYKDSNAQVTPIGEMVAVTSLSKAQIQALHTTPVQVVASPGSGYHLEIVRVIFDFDYNGTAYTASSGSVTIDYATSGVNAATTNQSILTGTSDDSFLFQLTTPVGGTSNAILSNLRNNALEINSTTQFSGEGGTATVRVYYKVL